MEARGADAKWSDADVDDLGWEGTCTLPDPAPAAVLPRSTAFPWAGDESRAEIATLYDSLP